MTLKPDDFAKGPVCWADLTPDMEPGDRYFLFDSPDEETHILILVRENARLRKRTVEGIFATNDRAEAERWHTAVEKIVEALPPGISYGQFMEALGKPFGEDHVLMPWEVDVSRMTGPEEDPE